MGAEGLQRPHANTSQSFFCSFCNSSASKERECTLEHGGQMKSPLIWKSGESALRMC